MIVEHAVCRDAQVEVLILHVSAKSEVHLWQTAAENCLVISVDNAVRLAVRTGDVLVEAVADVGTLLCGVIVKVALCACDSLVNPTVELTDLLTYVCGISAGDVRLGAEAK